MISSSVRLVCGPGVGVEVGVVSPYVLLLFVEVLGFDFVRLGRRDLSSFGVQPGDRHVAFCLVFRPILLINFPTLFSYINENGNFL